MRYFKFFNLNSKNQFDFINPTLIFILCLMSVFWIQSAEGSFEGSFWKMQIVWIFIGTFLYVLISFIDHRFFLYNAHIVYILGIFSLLLLWTPLGRRHFGSLRWIQIGFLTFQPSDLAKIGLLLLLSRFLVHSEKVFSFKNIFELFKVLFLSGIPFILIFLEPDLGSAFVIIPLVFSLLYIFGMPKRFFVTMVGISVLVFALIAIDVTSYYVHVLSTKQSMAEDIRKNSENLDKNVTSRKSKFVKILPLKDYQRDRILSCVVPTLIDPGETGISWNRKQSLISIGSGGFFGKGYKQGTQARLGYLPQIVAPNDFIFSVLAEESGFVGGTFVLLIYLILLINTLRIASLSKDKFGRFLSIGVVVIFLVHIFVNIGMTLGILPIKGIPLPFLSYGGSFVVTCFVLQGFVQSVNIHNRV